MPAGGRAVVWSVLIALFTLSVSSAGLVPAPCCSAACERCPILVCSPASAEPAQKTRVAHAVLPSAWAPPVEPGRPSAPAVLASQLPNLLAHEFRRPMRN